MKSETLFVLIKSLSKSEKRHFKLFLGMYSKDLKHSLILFDLLDKMKEYDKDAIKSGMYPYIDIKNIYALKSNLKTMILRSLRDLGTQKSNRSKIRTEVDYVYILYSKGMYASAKKMITNVYPLAVKSSYSSAIIELNNLKWLMAIKERDVFELKSFRELNIDHFSNQLDLESTLSGLREAMAQMYLLRTEFTTSSRRLIPQEAVDQLADNRVLHLDISGYPSIFKIYYHAVWGYIHFIRQNKNEAYFHLKQSVSLFESPEIDYELWSMNVHQLLTSLAKFEMFEEYGIELNSIIEITETIPKKFKYESFDQELYLMLLVAKTDKELISGNFEILRDHKTDLLNYFEKYGSQLNLLQQMVIYYNLAYIYIGIQDYKKALHWLNKLLNNPKFKGIRRDINVYSEILNIVIHYCLGNYEIMDSLVDRTIRKLERLSYNDELLTAFLFLARKAFKANLNNESKQLMNNFLKLCEHPNYSTNLKSMSYYFNIPRWLKNDILTKKIHN